MPTEALPRNPSPRDPVVVSAPSDGAAENARGAQLEPAVRRRMRLKLLGILAVCVAPVTIGRWAMVAAGASRIGASSSVKIVQSAPAGQGEG